MRLTVTDIRLLLKDRLLEQKFVIDKTGVKTIEIVNANFIADKQSIFGNKNSKYVKKEMDWYRSMSNNINDMQKPIPELWKYTAGTNGETNSNYGNVVFSDHVDSELNQSQFEYVVNCLVKDPNSRRALISYSRPSMIFEYKEHGKNDFICTNSVQYLIRDDCLDVIVNMRSNDAVFGFTYDRHWQEYVANTIRDQIQMLTGIRLNEGILYWNAGSLHVYERHFDLIK